MVNSIKKTSVKRVNMFKDKLMAGKENKKLILGVLLTFIVCMGSAILALDYPNPGHPANEIGPGTFNASGVSDALWYFPALLYTEYLKVYDSHNPSFVVTGNTSLGDDSSDKTTVKGDLDVSGKTTITGPLEDWSLIVNGGAMAIKGIAKGDTFNSWGALGFLVEPPEGGAGVFGSAGDSSDYSGYFMGGQGVKIKGDLDVSGNICLDSCRSTWPSGGGGCCSLLDTLNNNSDASGFTGTTTLGGDLDVSGNTQLGDSSSDKTTVKGNLDVSEDLEVSRDAQFGGDLSGDRNLIVATDWASVAGKHAVVFGYDSASTADYTVALGRSTASGDYGLATGIYTEAGYGAISAGYHTKALGAESIAAGEYTKATGSSSFVFGTGAGGYPINYLENNVDNSFMVGFNDNPTLVVDENEAKIEGDLNVSGNTQLGDSSSDKTTVKGNLDVSEDLEVSRDAQFGGDLSGDRNLIVATDWASVAGKHAVVFGYDSASTADYTVALGRSTASGDYGLATGIYTEAGYGAISAGYHTKALGAESIAAGEYTKATGSSSFVFGTGAGGYPINYLENNVDNSFMVGFNDNPTLVVDENEAKIEGDLNVSGKAKIGTTGTDTGGILQIKGTTDVGHGLYVGDMGAGYGIGAASHFNAIHGSVKPDYGTLSWAVRGTVLSGGTGSANSGAIKGESLVSDAYSGFFTGGKGVKIEGDLEVTGSKNAVINTSKGERKMSAVEAPTVNFVTSGSSQLINGEVEVKIKPLFLETINTEAGYQVLLTPTDNCQLYVSDKNTDNFVVKSSSGKKDCTFDWFLYGVRKGYEDWYMEK